MVEYRAQLDKERESRLYDVKDSSKKRLAISDSVDSDDESDDSDEGDNENNKKKRKKEKSKKHKKDKKKHKVIIFLFWIKIIFLQLNNINHILIYIPHPIYSKINIMYVCMYVLYIVEYGLILIAYLYIYF